MAWTQDILEFYLSILDQLYQNYQLFPLMWSFLQWQNHLIEKLIYCYYAYSYWYCLLLQEQSLTSSAYAFCPWDFQHSLSLHLPIKWAVTVVKQKSYIHGTYRTWNKKKLNQPLVLQNETMETFRPRKLSISVNLQCQWYSYQFSEFFKFILGKEKPEIWLKTID